MYARTRAVSFGLVARGICFEGAALVAVAIVGCQLVVPTDGLTGGGDDAAPSDGAGADVSGDAGPSPDANGDVAADASDASTGCEGGTTSCGGMCVDTQSDIHNCGACGHDCMFSACTNGACAAVDVATGLASPHGIALDANDVYVGTYGDGAVLKIPKVGGQPTQLDKVSGGQPSIFVVIGSTLYWTDYATGEIASVPVGGGTHTRLLGGLVNPFGLTADANNFYFTDNASGVIGSFPLGSPPITDGGTGSYTQLATGLNMPVLVAVDATTAYVTAVADVWSLPVGGGSPSPVAAVMQGRAWGLAIDANNVYFGEEEAGVIASQPLGGGSMVTLATAQDQPRAVAIDGGYVYWCERGGGHVRKVPIGGGAVTDLAFNEGGPLDLAIDATTVYWTNYDGGAVRKVAK